MNIKQNIFSSIAYTSLFLAIFSVSGKEIGKTFFHRRPQGSNSAHALAGTMYLEQIIPCERNYNRFAVTLEYIQAFNDRGLGEYLFFNGGTRMRFGKAGEKNVDVFSRNFFLNDDFQGTASIDPVIKNFITHLDLSIDLSCWKQGLYVAVHAPLVWTLWDLQLSETNPTTEKIGECVPAQTFGNSSKKASPLKSIVDAWKGNTLNTNADETDDTKDFFPDLKQPMKFAAVNGQQTQASVGDIQLTVGYNIITKQDAHFDVQGRVIIPTGTRPNAQFFFEPIAGNGRFFQLGLGLTGHENLWCQGDNSFSFYVDAGIYYQFKSRQKRTFDLKNNGIGSRYLLFKRFDASENYANEVLFGPNVTTLDCRVKSDFMVDTSVSGEYTWRCLRLSLGYNLWARAKETIKLVDSIPKNTFGIQGNAKTNDNNTASKTRINGKNADNIDPLPVFIGNDDLDLSSAAHPLSVSHKLFASIGYGWIAHPYTPFFVLGIQGELPALSNTALKEIGTWAKGGFTF